MKRNRWNSSSDEEESPVWRAPDKVIRTDALSPSSPMSDPYHQPEPDDTITDGLTAERSMDNDTSELQQGFKRHNPLLSGCRSVYDSYERLNRIDEGTYGVVWKARDSVECPRYL